MMTSTTRSATPVAVLCMAAGLLAGLPAIAAQPVRVKLSSNPQVTYQRLQTASALACGSVNRSDLARYSVWSRCYRLTLQDAIDQVNEPTLVALHRQRLGKDATG